MKKNHVLHLNLEKELKETLKIESDKQRIFMSEFVRRSLRKSLQLDKPEENSQLNRIENTLNELVKVVADFGKRSSKIRNF